MLLDADCSTWVLALTEVRPLEVAALALRRDDSVTLPRLLLLIEVASLPDALAEARLEAEPLLWAARESEEAALAVPEEDLRDVVEVPEAELPEEAAALLRLLDAEALLLRLLEAEELLLPVVAAERRLPDCWLWAALWLLEEAEALLRLLDAAELLLVVAEERRLVDDCWAEERLAELFCCDAAAELLLALLRDTLAEEEERSLEELTLVVLEDLVAELPEEPVALRLACALSASGVKAIIAIARTLTIRDLTKVFIRLIY